MGTKRATLSTCRKLSIVGALTRRPPCATEKRLARRLVRSRGLPLSVYFFNVFNKLNLQPFSFGTDNTKIENTLFGRAPGALAGRVIEFQAKLTF